MFVITIDELGALKRVLVSADINQDGPRVTPSVPFTKEGGSTEIKPIPVTRSQSARAVAPASNPFNLPLERQEAGRRLVYEVPFVPPPVHTPAEPTDPTRIETAPRFAHRYLAHVGGVSRHGSQAWIGQVPNEFDRERDIFHFEIQCTFSAFAKFDEAEPCDSIKRMLLVQSPWFDDRDSQERDLMELFADDEELMPGGLPLDSLTTWSWRN